ncbi:hypothetical protein [Streptosporangium sp. KLBMP 9127]|nr:hypothetical protein [Streptosporangium sp. KLBMP 9127]
MSTEYGGVHITGGEMSGAVAFGPHARATVNNFGDPALPPELAALLDRLDELIADHAGSLDQPRNAARDAADIRGELETPDPDRSRVADALKRLAARAAEVTVIVEVITRIRDLLA